MCPRSTRLAGRLRSVSVALLALSGSVVWLACDDAPTRPILADAVGADGGVVTAPGVRLSIPPGAVPEGTTITVERATPDRLPAGVDFPADSLLPGTLHDFGPDGLTFATPATLTLDYDPDRFPPGTDESRLRVARIGSTYEIVPVTNRDTLNDRISIEVDHFTFFGVLVPRLVPDFTARISVQESVGIADGVGTIKSLDPVVISVEEQIGIIDAVDVSAPGIVRISVDEEVGISESLVPPDPGVQPVPVSVEEAIAVADAVTLDVPGVVGIDVSETIGVSDAPLTNIVGAATPAATEAIAVSDVVDVQVLSPATLYVGTGAGALDRFTPGLVPVSSVDMPGQVGYVARRPGTDEVWVAERGTDSLVVVDAATDSRIAAEYSGTVDPFAIDFDAAGAIAVIADNDADRLTVFDAATLTQSGLSITNFGIPSPTGVQVSGDGTRAWVVGSNVATVDVPGRTPLALADAGSITFASDVDLTSDESELWVLDGLAGNIVVYDAATLAVLDTLDLSAGTTTGGEQLTFSDDGATAYATTASAGELVVIDVASRTELTRYAIGSSTSWVAHDSAQNLVFMTSVQLDDELIVFDLDAGAVTGRISYSAPRGILLFR